MWPRNLLSDVQKSRYTCNKNMSLKKTRVNMNNLFLHDHVEQVQESCWKKEKKVQNCNQTATILRQKCTQMLCKSDMSVCI